MGGPELQQATAFRKLLTLLCRRIVTYRQLVNIATQGGHDFEKKIGKTRGQVAKFRTKICFTQKNHENPEVLPNIKILRSPK